MNRTAIMLICLIMAELGFGQQMGIQSRSVLGELTILAPTVENFIAVLKLTNGDWEKSILSLGYEKSMVSENRISFQKGSPDQGGMNFVSKLFDNFVFAWCPVSSTNTVLDSLINEIEPYYDKIQNEKIIY